MPNTQSVVNHHEYRSVPVTALIESASNPRKRFDEKSLEELAAYVPGHISCQAQECQPDVVLLDVSMPELNGLQAAPLVKKVAPDTEILFVTQYDNPFFVRQALAAGARGFLTKSDAGPDLLTAIRAVHMKREFISRGIRKAAVTGTVEH